MPLCIATRRDGAPCAAQALAGGEHCFFHSPSAEHVRARSRGRWQGGIVVRSRSHVEISELSFTTWPPSVVRPIQSPPVT